MAALNSLVKNSITKDLQSILVEITELVMNIETIYFGGGTPSLLSKEEISLEANPDDLTETKIDELAKSSINRLSIRNQSFF